MHAVRSLLRSRGQINVLLANPLRSAVAISTSSKRCQSTNGEAARPSRLLANSGLELLTFGTPNGHKVSMFLEELKDAYGLQYTTQSIHIGENIQKEPWFTKLGPNGRIPVLVDHDKGGHAVMEGAAILTYLARFYDPKKLFTFEENSLDYNIVEQWIAWQTGGIGPMQGQANHFFRLAKERIPYPTQRYVGETERLYGVLDKRLEGREYIVGSGKGKFSIADIANFSWINFALFAGVDYKRWSNLYAWWQRMWDRPAIQRGCNIPSESGMINAVLEKKLIDDTEARGKFADLQSHLTKAQEQYQYQYSSP